MAVKIEKNHVASDPGMCTGTGPAADGSKRYTVYFAFRYTGTNACGKAARVARSSFISVAA
jgi:hypothetical protein